MWGGVCNVQDLTCVIGHPVPLVLLGARPRRVLQVSLPRVLGPPCAPKEARGYLQPTNTGCQHNGVCKSMSLESRGSWRSLWWLLISPSIRISVGAGHWMWPALFHFSVQTDSNCTSRGEDLIRYFTVESLCCILETNRMLYRSYNLIKKDEKLFPPSTKSM